MGALDNLDAFCQPVSQFWRRGPPQHCTFTVNSTCHDEVDLSLCFEDTAILYGISVLLWLLAVAEFSYSKRRQATPSSSLNWVILAKLGVLVVPVATAVCDLVYSIYQAAGTDQEVAYYLYLSPIVLALSMVVIAMVMLFERALGVRSSGLVFLFWMGLAIYGLFKFRSLVLIARDEDQVSDVFRFVTFCFQFVAFLTEFVLSFFAEPKSKRYYHFGDEDERKPCPENDATFLSRITWWWLTGLIWRGWRKALDYSELTALNPEDKSGQVAPRFQQNWDREINKAGITYHTPVPEEAEYQPINVGGDSDVHVLTPLSRTGPDGRGQRSPKEPSLSIALARSFGGMFMMAALFKVTSDLLGFASPQILKLMIRYTEDPLEPAWRGYLYAVLLFIAAVVQSLCLHQYWHRCFTVGMRARTAIIAAIYSKALRMSSKARRNTTVGEIVNLMSVDAQRIMDLAPYLHMLWSAPLQIVVALVLLWFTMGPSIFAGFVVMVLLIPLNAIIAILARQLQVTQMMQKDSRIKLMNEVLNGIRVIKLYAWEIPFKKLIMDIRQGELSTLRKSAYLNAGFSFTWTCAPFLVSLATFATYALINRDNPDERLTADKVFVALSLFNIIRFPLSLLPMLITFVVQASVSVKRLRNFLKSDELDPSVVQWRPEPARDHEDAVSVVDGKFTWDDPERPTLSNIDLHVKPGQLVAVVGHVGAGKSSLVQALLGEMDKLGGSVAIKGHVAYVPQQAWIQNATLKDNILFGKGDSHSLYKRTVDACALTPDLEILPAGDQTEIGEKGINLSGGQKQRVSLARSVYQEADVYLLDDPLSAVDSHVGKHIFEEVIGPCGVLKNKVRVLVTHGVGFLSQCDQIVVMDGGRITEVGTYNDLMDDDGVFADFIRTYANVEETEEEDPTLSEYAEFEENHLQDVRGNITGLYEEAEAETRKMAIKKHLERSRSVDCSKVVRPELKRRTSRVDLIRQLSKQQSIRDEEQKEEAGNLIAEEMAQKGNVKLSVLTAYVKACTYSLTLLVVLFFILNNGASVGSNFWLAHYSNQQGQNNTNATANGTAPSQDLALFLGVYAGLGFSQALFILLGSFTMATAAIFASTLLHNEMLDSILRSPMSFFDTTPLGRVLNRFSKDIYTIDETIPSSLRTFLMTLFGVVSTIIVIVIATPIFLAVIVPLAVLYVLIQRFYVATSRQLKRLESITRSPIYTHFQETITGASSIRAYHQQERFVVESNNRVDHNQVAYYPSICANRWLAIRLEFLGNLIILFAALFAAIQRNYGDQINLPISAGLVGLSITYALQVTSVLNMTVRMTSELETNIVAVERTKEYTETANEAPAVIESNRPRPDWPAAGHVKFDHYSTRYREGLDLVLKDIAADVPAGTKVGIVGRTGAGKSSLTLALFRIIEPANGAILIDGFNIVEFGLEDLRSRITIIPQDPVLFSGTLRMNLDPFESYSDEEVWRSLENAHLSAFVSTLGDRLQHPIAEGGENLSVGQRQLVCLARALLRKTKILVLDEATAAVDLETDDLIQKTIRSEFADCTVITIAHRLNTVMDYDFIMVLDAGRVVEFEAPAELINKRGVFYSMAKDAGLVA